MSSEKLVMMVSRIISEKGKYPLELAVHQLPVWPGLPIYSCTGGIIGYEEAKRRLDNGQRVIIGETCFIRQ